MEDLDAESDSRSPRVLTFTETKEAAQRIEGGIIHTPLCVCIYIMSVNYVESQDFTFKNISLLFSNRMSEWDMFSAMMNYGWMDTPIFDATSDLLRIFWLHWTGWEAKLSKFTDYDIYLKCENMQYTGSAAERGIRNALMKSIKLYKEKGLLIASIGNYALAAAYHGGVLGVSVTVIMPENTCMSRVQRCKDLDAEVILAGQTFDSAQKQAMKGGKGRGQYLNCSDQVDALAGLGTVGLEIISQLPETDAVIAPVGAGGLLAGVLVACKKLKCSCLVYGVESSKVPTMMSAMQAGKPVEVPVVPSIADGLSSVCAGVNSFETINGKLDRMLVVDDVWIGRAMLSIMEREKLIVDGAGACAVAAVMQGLVPELRGKRVVCVISGGNIDSNTLVRVIQRGLAASFRLAKFTVVVNDSPGAMAELMQVIACSGATVKSLTTEHTWMKRDINTISVKVIAETSGEKHTESLKAKLRQRFAQVFYTSSCVC